MASTNKTTHYNLSQYIGTDKPTYLVDYNTDMSNIDAGIYSAKSESEVNTSAIGTLASLDTTAKTDLVSAVNEVNTKANDIGNLSNLTTEANTNLVSAINEVDAHADSNNQNIGTMVNLETTVKTSLVGAVNEVNTKSSNNANNIGTLNNLKTTNKTSLVNAVNEVIDNQAFSTNEIDTHKVWINNKKIYRKSYVVNNPESDIEIESGINGGIEEIISLNGTIKDNEQIFPLPTPGYSFATGIEVVTLKYFSINSSYRTNSFSFYNEFTDFTPTELIFTIEYTKNSD